MNRTPVPWLSLQAALLALLLSFSLHAHPSSATSTISPGHHLTGDATITSQSGNFVLGFFTPGQSSNSYIGVWFKKIPKMTPVWVANRVAPVQDPSSSQLTIAADGNLALLNRSGSLVWTTNATASMAPNSTVAELLDTGNLVLRDGRNSSRVFWQSFDHPTDTWLPGGKLGLNKLTGEAQRLVSWKNTVDPSPGIFSLETDPNGSGQYYVVWNSSVRFWSSGIWNGKIFNNVPEMVPGSGSNFAYISNAKEDYFTYSSVNQGIISRFVVDLSGQIEQLIWVDTVGWTLFWTQPRGQCDVHRLCGPNGVCVDKSFMFCSCVQGFVVSSTDWKLSDRTGGCVRRTPLRCESRAPAGGDQDGFYAMPNVTLPENGQPLAAARSAGDCETACLGNCSCTAYSHGTDGCSLWHHDLFNLRQLPDGGATLNLRLAAAELQISKASGYSLQLRLPDKKEKAIIIDTIIAAAVLLAVIILIICLVWRYKKKTLTGFWKKWKQLVVVLLHCTSSGSILSIKNGKEEAGEDVPLQSFEFITAITSNFSDSNKLGEGGFGKVYKGIMPTGVEVAVKRLSRGSSQGQEEFKNEVALIAKLQHRNLVKLVGSCIHGEERILIYEYVPNSSLSNFLFDSIKQVELDWETRFNIIKGIARGMLYLHQDSRFKIVHRDLKASNILLDEDMNPKISDFGMARIFGENQSRCITHRVVGTYGYMSPEYAMEGHYSVKSDVYSFGVLLLEIISGRRNNIFYRNEICLNLLTYAWHMWKEENVMGFLDSSIASTSSPTADQVSRCLHVGLLCVQDHVNKRPFMSSIVFMLENDTSISDKPKRPMFMLEAAQDGGDVPKTGRTCPSVNGLSITVVKGR